MDEIVRQAMVKWPNVPHCYGWLALDARGTWRMRDERAQALNLSGDPIRNPTLLGFINRNYMHDGQGRWYFQNGPQRVYVNLEATPYIARTDPVHDYVLHTGDALDALNAAWLTEDGRLLLESGERIAMVDDRDMAQSLTRVQYAGRAASDAEILEWLARPKPHVLTLEFRGKAVPIMHVERGTLASRFGFVSTPRPDADVQGSAS